jgi:hypothetical protein
MGERPEKVLTNKYHLSICCSGKKSSDQIINNSYLSLGDRGTYKQALRGLFTSGTSLPHVRETKEKVGR